jgi:hypothetical protein
LITLARHGGLGGGAQDLPPLLHAAGLTSIVTDATEFQMLGRVRG